MVGHKSIDCYKNKKERKWCSHCKSKTHTDKTCRKIDQAKKSNLLQPESHTYAFKIGDDDYYLPVDKNNSFLVDCGATTHIVNVDQDFIYVDESFKPEEHYVELADGTRSNNVAKKRGTVIISLHNEHGNLVKVTLENALYIPSYPSVFFPSRLQLIMVQL